MVDFTPIEPIAPGDQMFRSDGAHPDAVALTFGKASNRIPYARFYKDAGDALVLRAIEHHEQDAMLFPALYCYRHAIEIVLKDAIHIWQRANGDGGEPLRTHKLAIVWRRARNAFEAAWPEGDPAELDAAGRLIAELDAVDPDAEQFRYALDRRGLARDLPAELERVDMRNLTIVIDRLFVFLAGGSEGITDLASYAPDHQDY